MGKIKGGIEHKEVSESTTITTQACVYYGCTVVNKTTGGVKALIYDASATAQGNLTDVLTVNAGTYNNQGSWYQNGVIMHSGIHVYGLVCTTASDSIVIFYGGL